VIEVPGRLHPLEILYRPTASVGEAAREALARVSGSVLCFLPGAGEVRRAALDVSNGSPGVDVLELHGSLPAAEQDRIWRLEDGQSCTCL
jgi:ATP-dependent helicase HrpB